MKKRQSPKNGIALTERAKDVLFGYGLLLPTFLVFSIVILYPIISAVIRSFCDYTFLTVNKPLKWNDFANYKTIFKNGFLTQLWTTMKFTVGTVGIELVLGMSIALLLNTKIRGRNALRSVFLMPWCIPSIVMAVPGAVRYHQLRSVRPWPDFQPHCGMGAEPLHVSGRGDHCGGLEADPLYARHDPCRSAIHQS